MIEFMLTRYLSTIYIIFYNESKSVYTSIGLFVFAWARPRLPNGSIFLIAFVFLVKLFYARLIPILDKKNFKPSLQNFCVDVISRCFDRINLLRSKLGDSRRYPTIQWLDGKGSRPFKKKWKYIFSVIGLTPPPHSGYEKLCNFTDFVWLTGSFSHIIKKCSIIAIIISLH